MPPPARPLDQQASCEMKRNPKLSLIVPCYDEAEVLPLLRPRLLHTLDPLALPWEVSFGADGSHDSPFEQLTAMHRSDPRFKVIALSRNFGHQIALAAGLAHASGDVVAIMDADLQDPPELLGQGVQKLEQ